MEYKEAIEITGIDTNGKSIEEIKRELRLLVSKYHPDNKYGNESKFILYNEAKEVILTTLQESKEKATVLEEQEKAEEPKVSEQRNITGTYDLEDTEKAIKSTATKIYIKIPIEYGLFYKEQQVVYIEFIRNKRDYQADIKIPRKQSIFLKKIRIGEKEIAVTNLNNKGAEEVTRLSAIELNKYIKLNLSIQLISG
jgi:DnaJ-class molecular chaperone